MNSSEDPLRTVRDDPYFHLQSTAELIGQAYRTCLQHVALLVSITLLPHIVLLAVDYALPDEQIGGGLLLAVGAVTIVLNALTLGALTAAFTLIAVGRTPGLVQAYTIALRENLLQVVLAFLFMACAVFAGFMMLFIPGIIVGGLFAPMIPIVILERRSVINAASRSIAMVRADLPKAIAIFAFFITLSGILPLLLVMWQVSTGLGPLSPLLGAIVGSVTLPPAFAANVFLYFSLRGEEGLTAEQLFAELTGSPSETT